MSVPPHGLVLGARLHAAGAARVVEAAAVAAGAGCTSLWTVEARSFDAFGLLGAVARSCPGVDLGTGVVPAPLRPPTLAAMGAATLAALSPGATAWLGVGTSTPAIASGWHGTAFGPRPLARLEEYVSVVRRALSGDTVRFAGRFYAVDGFRLERAVVGAEPPRVVVAALGPGTTALAGRAAGGVLLNAVPVSRVVAAAEAARDAGNETVWSFVHVGLDAGPAGLDTARRSLAAEMLAEPYARHFGAAGYGSVVEQVRRAFARTDRAGAWGAVPEEMCRDLYCFGGPAEVRAYVDAYRAAGIRPVLMPEVLSDDPVAEVATLAAAVGSPAPVDRGP